MATTDVKKITLRFYKDCEFVSIETDYPAFQYKLPLAELGHFPAKEALLGVESISVIPSDNTSLPELMKKISDSTDLFKAAQEAERDHMIKEYQEYLDSQ